MSKKKMVLHFSFVPECFFFQIMKALQAQIDLLPNIPQTKVVCCGNQEDTENCMYFPFPLSPLFIFRNEKPWKEVEKLRWNSTAM